VSLIKPVKAQIVGNLHLETDHRDEQEKHNDTEKEKKSPVIVTDDDYYLNTDGPSFDESDNLNTMYHKEIAHFKLGDLLGEGAYGKVYLGLNGETGELMAVKKIPILTKSSADLENYLRNIQSEIAVLNNLRHENIVSYLGTKTTNEVDPTGRSLEYLNIFLEFVAGGSVASLLKRFGSFSEILCKAYTKQLLTGLEYLHRNSIVHRDLKSGASSNQMRYELMRFHSNG